MDRKPATGSRPLTPNVKQHRSKKQVTQEQLSFWALGLRTIHHYRDRLASRLESLIFRQPQPAATPYQLPAFDTFTYSVAVPPPQPNGIAWDKLAECERRLEMYKWAERLNDPRTPQHRVLLDDCVSAFLLTFEATLQFVNDQFLKRGNMPSFNTWLAQLPQHDLNIKGLRTLRHFAAHVEIKPMSSLIALVIGGTLSNGTSATSVSRRWRLPELQPSDLQKLRTPALQANDLPAWNALAEQSSVVSILTHGLHQLRDILLEAEKIL